MNSNPYIETLMQKIHDPEWEEPTDDPVEELSPMTLAVLAIAHELGVANAPLRSAARNGESHQEDLGSLLKSQIWAIPDESDDARIAAAARRWADAYGRRNVTGRTVEHHLAASELLEAVRQEEER